MSIQLVVLGAALLVAAASIATGVQTQTAAIALILVTLALVIARSGYVPWPRLVAALILVILFIPIRRYTLPASLPFELEPYRVFVAVLLLVWLASLLVDPRVRFRRTGLEGPLALIVLGAGASVVANPDRVALASTEVDKRLMFLLSFVLVLFLIVGVTRRIDHVDQLVKTLVLGGAIVAVFAIVEGRTGFNVFNHLSRVLPVLNYTGDGGGPNMLRFGSARLRVFGSAQHPIALSAAFVVLTPLAFYLARRYAQRRWLLCALVLVMACASTVSRTGVVMFATVGVVYLVLWPRETLRRWPAVLVALLAIHFVLPGTLGSLKNSFAPPGGLINEQANTEVGSGRIASLGPGLREWKRQPVLGQGHATRGASSPSQMPKGFILDNQWLTSMIETGAIGLAAWVWFFARALRRFGREAKRDASPRGWLLAAITAGVAAFAVGMFTYDAFAFIQVTFLLFILVGIGAAALAESPLPHPVVRARRALLASEAVAARPSG